MKTVAEVIGVSRSNLVERLQERPKKRIGRPPLPDAGAKPPPPFCARKSCSWACFFSATSFLRASFERPSSIVRSRTLCSSSPAAIARLP